MKNIKSTIISMAIGVLLITSCSDLNEVPFSFVGVENLYQNESDVDAAILGVYQPLFQNGVLDLYLFLIMSGPSENITARAKGGAQGRFASCNFVPTDPHNGLWVNCYRGINRANTAMAAIPNVGLDTGIENAKLAEARYMRGFYYFWLVRMFGDLPLHTEPTTSFDDDAVKKPRVSVQQIYDLIIEDLQFAEMHLPTSWDAANQGRATVSAAKTLLGKAYLTMAGRPLAQSDKFALAASKLREVLGTHSLEADYADIFSISNEFNDEIIFARPNISNIDGSGTVLTFMAGAPNTVNAFNGGQYQFGFVPAFYDSYDTLDTRRDVTMDYHYESTFGPVTFGSADNPKGLRFGGPRPINGIPYGKLKDPTNTLNPFGHGNDLIFLRYADVLLMLAEAENEAGNSSAALDPLNQVRERAGLAPITETNQAALRDIIKQERKWELAGEYTEYFDLQRWGDLEAAMAVNPISIQLNVNYEPKLELLPIPRAQLLANGNLVQNPGY